MIRPLGNYSKSLIEVATFLNLNFEANIQIRGISSSSNEIESGDLFVALAGANRHGAEFLSDAIKKGAVAVLTDKTGAKLVGDKLPTLEIENPRNVLGPLSNWFYEAPSTKFTLVGITGTNGKTTTTYLLNQIWKSAGKSTAQIGTLGVEICAEEFKTGFTTPEADTLAKIFAVASEKQVTQAAMEVSSIALSASRVAGTHFKYVAFTNLTQDHLDYHKTMADYGAAKAKLFTLAYGEHAFINIDDEFGKKILENCEIPATTVSRANRSANWHFEKFASTGGITQIAIRGIGGILIEGEISLIGEHNLDNLLLAIAIAVESGVDPLVIAAALPSLRGAPGRLEVVNKGQDFIALVDFAHTPDAVTRSLQAARKLSNHVIGVLGCGGDRDSSKRPLMGVELATGCDLAIFTSDNPRSESPDSILDAMLSRVEISENVHRISDRREAIAFAVASAKAGDCVIVLGKGHETGQEINGQIYKFDDRIELAKAIESLS